MEKPRRSPANSRPNQISRPAGTSPGNSRGEAPESEATRESGRWDWILNDNDRLRQLVDRARRASVDYDYTNRQRKPNLALANLPRGPASQAHGWLKIAIDRETKPGPDKLDFPVDYSNNPVEQSLLWLILNFDPSQAEPEIIETVELLAAGQLEAAFDRLDDYVSN